MLAPVLMMAVLFVLWAGRSGQTELVADLAAEEAATLAATCCEHIADPVEKAAAQEAAARQALESKAALTSMCRARGIEATDPDKGLVSSRLLLADEETAARRTLGVLEVDFSCVSDSAVLPLYGYFGSVNVNGRATEAFIGAVQASTTLPKLHAVGVRTDPSDSTKREELLAFEDGNPVGPRGLAEKAAAAAGSGYGLQLTLDRVTDRPVVVRVRPDIDPAQQGLIARPGHAWPGVDAHTGDYRYFDREITFPPGQVEYVVPIEVFDDSVDEYDEELLISIEVVAGAEATAHSASLILADDDPAPFIVVQDGPNAVEYLYPHEAVGTWSETDNYTGCAPGEHEGQGACMQLPHSQSAASFQVYLAQQPDDELTVADERAVFPDRPWEHYAITEKYIGITCRHDTVASGFQRAARVHEAADFVLNYTDVLLEAPAGVAEPCDGSQLLLINPCLPGEACRTDPVYYDPYAGIGRSRYRQASGYYWTQVGIKIVNDGCKDWPGVQSEAFSVIFEAQNPDDVLAARRTGGPNGAYQVVPGGRHRVDIEIADDERDGVDPYCQGEGP